MGIHIPNIFPIQWGAVWCYLELPNQIIVWVGRSSYHCGSLPTAWVPQAVACLAASGWQWLDWFLMMRPPPKIATGHRKKPSLMIPSGNLLHNYGNHHRNSEFSHEKWWFSIVMLNYQRVNLLGLAAAPPMVVIPSSNQNNRAPKTDHDPHEVIWYIPT